MTPRRAIARAFRWSVPAILLSAAAQADPVTVTMAGSFIHTITAGGQTISAHQLRAGLSSGPADQTHPSAFSINAADGRNLGFYFARSGGEDQWDVHLGQWNDTNGSGYDFFVFEAGGNDNLQVAAMFPGGGVGQPVSVSGWTSTGYQVTGGPNHNQLVHGLGFRSTQLKRPNGSAVTNGDTLIGIRLYASTIDGAGFLAVDPNPATGVDGDGSAVVLGELRKWRPIEVQWRGPWASETDDAPNPFLDRRLNVTFTGPSGQQYTVPGFFNGDGMGGGTGNVWSSRFTTDEVGTWTARASFRGGTDVAIELAPFAGSGVAPLHNKEIEFEIGNIGPHAEGFWQWGWLEYAGHYPKFREGPHFIKAGVNSPENFLGYRGFEEVSDLGCIGILHEFESHIADWNPGDPNFRSNVYPYDGRAIIGAINYLASEGVNSIFAMVMNLGGDGCDTHPFLGNANTVFNKTHYDVGRLFQWNTVFEHAASKGIAMHFGLAETEQANEKWLDNGTLGVERKLFFRELIARFAHLPALKWTLCEENDYSTPLLREFADYIRALDVYGHAVGFHNHPNDLSQYQETAGEERFSATSVQYNENQASDQVETLRNWSASQGHPWAVQMDENNPWNVGLNNVNATEMRKRILYDVLFSGGHIEWYFGWYQFFPGGDLTVEDFRTREEMYPYMRYAREVLQTLPFWEMDPQDNLVTGEDQNFGGAEVFAKQGEAYAIYLPGTNPTGTLNLNGAPGTYLKRWYNPRTGEFQGNPQVVSGGGNHALGNPPADQGNDWVLIFQNYSDFSASDEEVSVSSSDSILFDIEPGPAYAGRNYLLVGSFTGVYPGFEPNDLIHIPVNNDRYFRFLLTASTTGNPVLINTTGQLDSNGTATARIRFLPAVYGALVGTTLHHSYVLTNPIDYASSALPLLLTP